MVALLTPAARAMASMLVASMPRSPKRVSAAWMTFSWASELRVRTIVFLVCASNRGAIGFGVWPPTLATRTKTSLGGGTRPKKSGRVTPVDFDFVEAVGADD